MYISTEKLNIEVEIRKMIDEEMEKRVCALKIGEVRVKCIYGNGEVETFDYRIDESAEEKLRNAIIKVIEAY